MEMKPMVYKNERSAEILYEGNVQGYDFRIISQGTHPCAYVKVPKSHPFFKQRDNNIRISCHGGITYASNFLYGDEQSKKSETWWIGWDYAHWSDYVGYGTTWVSESDRKWTTQEIYQEVINVIARLRSVENA